MKTEAAVLGGGCFWCLEAVFLEVKGVTSVESAYAGGDVANPAYEQVCDGGTGHAEVVRVEFDPGKISYRELLNIFFGIHDPTTMNRQGNDVGTQYRSVIFTTSESQAEIALATIAELEREEVFESEIVTRVAPLPNYFPAESHHQRYFEQHPNQGYCSVVVGPKVAKFRKSFGRFVSAKPAAVSRH